MKPAICQFYITLRCNDACEFCGCWQKKDYQNNPLYSEVSTDELKKAVRNLRTEGIQELIITGGEPLLSSALPAVLEEAKLGSMKTTLFTNCILYPEKAKELQGIVDRLFFSLDYPFPEMHDRSRGRSVFNKVIKSIETATYLKEDPIIFYTVTRDSILYLPEAIEFSEKFSVNLVLNPVYDFGGTQGFARDSIEYLSYFGRRKNVFVNLAQLEFIRSGGNNIAWPRCRAREKVVTLLPSAKIVSPCFFNPDGRQGREIVCNGCMRWPYMLPSFSTGWDKYRLLDWLTGYLWQKRGNLKEV